MPRFFTDALRFDIEHQSGMAVLDGEDGRHIARSLRMRIGEPLTLSDGAGFDYDGEIEDISGDTVTVRLTKQYKNESEPTLRVTLYPGMPKSDKLDLVVQKATELGAAAVVPVLTDRSVSRPDGKSAAKKQERLQRIAQEYAVFKAVLGDAGRIQRTRGQFHPLAGGEHLGEAFFVCIHFAGNAPHVGLAAFLHEDALADELRGAEHLPVGARHVHGRGLTAELTQRAQHHRNGIGGKPHAPAFIKARGSPQKRRLAFGNQFLHVHAASLKTPGAVYGQPVVLPISRFHPASAPG